MKHASNGQTTVIRTGRGLTIAGTRITLYQLLDSLKAGQPEAAVRDQFRLTIKQMQDVMHYIENHADEVEAEYQQVLAQAEANRRYWEERNRARFEQARQQAPHSEKAELWQKLQAWKAELDRAE